MLLKILHVLFIALCYFVGVGYCFHRFKQIFQEHKVAFAIVKCIGVAMSALFLLVIFLRLLNLNSFFLPFQLIAYLWMIFVFYLFAILLLADVVLLLLKCFNFRKNQSVRDKPAIRHVVFYTGVLVSISLMIYGLIHFTKPQVHYLTIETEKVAPDCKMVVLSDLHLGTMSTDLFLKNVNRINELHPDVVLLLGDQFVVNRQDAVKMGYADIMRKIDAPLGVYAINGNHEFYHGYLDKQDAGVSDFYKNMNVTMLEDTAFVVDNQFVLIGRMDSSKIVSRKSLLQLVKDISTEVPIVVMDHEPNDLGSSKQCGVDLHLSGHTHHGQIFPMNWIQDMKSLFLGKLNYGYRKDGTTQYFVTSGLGGSGAPVRIGTTGEIVVIQWKQKMQ